MLTRFRFKRDFRLIVRCLSDKHSENDGKIVPEEKTKAQDDQKKNSEFRSEKIQELLKSMMAEPKINESEYREKFATAPDIPKRRKENIDDVETKMEKIEENITKAASEVAQAIGGDVKQTEAELLSKVLGKINQTSTTLSDLIIGMKVEHKKEGEEFKKETRGQQVKYLATKARDDVNRSRYMQRKSQVSEKRRETDTTLSKPSTFDISSGEPLGIFNVKEPNYGTKLDVWQQLKQRELALATAQPPANYFQKMILWTEQGKVWKFPIDNEQGIEEEQNIHFSEHIFLDQHLEGWCPKKGPIRHFMELVCVGLSKNAFYTVKEKKDHIMWYKEYFESKKDLLTEVGAWDIPTQSNTEAST